MDSKAFAPTVATGLVLVWSGIHALAVSLGVSVVGYELYLATQCISAAVLLWAAWIFVSAGDLHGGVVPMLFGLSVLTGICGAVTGDHSAVPTLRLSFVLPLALSAAMMLLDGMRSRGIGTALLAGAMLSASALEAVSGPLLMASGAVLAFSAFRPDAPANDEPSKTCRILLLELISVHAGMMLLSNGLVIGECMGASVSMAIAIVSAYTFRHGGIVPGCCGMMYSFAGLISGIPFIGENGEETVAVAVAAMACVFVGALAFIGKERMVGIGVAASGIGLTIWSIAGTATGAIVGSGILLLLCLAEAVPSWKRPETEDHELEGLGRIAGVSSAGMMVLAVAILADAAVELSGATRGSLDLVTLVGSAFMVGFSVMAMRGRMLTEAMIFLMAGCYLFVHPLSDVLEDPNGMMPVGVTLCIGFAVASYVYWRMGAWMRSVGCALLVTSLILAGIGTAEYVHTVPAIIAGILLLAVSAKKMFRFGVTADARIEERPNLIQSDNQYAAVLVMAICTIILMMLALIGEISDLLPKGNLPLSVFRLMLLFAILGFGMYSMRMGFTVLGIYLLGSFLACFLLASLPAVGLHLPTGLCILSSVIFVPSVIAFLAMRNYVMTANSTMMLLTVLTGPFIGSTWGFDLIVLVFKTVSGLIGLTLWIEYDVGRVIVPKYSRLWRRDLITEGPERPIRPCILFSGLMVASVMTVWMAASPFMGDVDRTAFCIATATASVLCMATSACLFHSGSPNWGVFTMLLSIGIAAYCVSEMLTGGTGVWMAVCPPLAVLAFVCAIRGYRAVPAMSIAGICAFALMDVLPVAGSAIFALIGATMAIVGARGMVSGTSWTAPSELEGRWTVAMAGIVGLCVCLFGPDSMLVASLVSSVFIMAAAFGCGSRGMHAECLALLSASIPGFTVSASLLWGADLSVVPLVIPAVLTAVSAMMFGNDGRRVESIVCAIGTVLVVAAIATGSWIPATIGCMAACLAVVVSGIMPVPDQNRIAPCRATSRCGEEHFPGAQRNDGASHTPSLY